jgi:y4mF family transcriptional regulator
LASSVRSRRRALGLRQAEVAELAGCSERFVYTVERAKGSVRMDKVLDVLAVLGLGLEVGVGTRSVVARTSGTAAAGAREPGRP